MTWIQTATGAAFDLLNPTPDQIRWKDIAISLSQQCRFNGATNDGSHLLFYSVAEHSCWVAQKTPLKDRRWALLHDAAEAYVGDITSPMKQLLGEKYRDIERPIVRAIAQKFGLEGEMSESVRKADMRMLATERQQLMVPCENDWGLNYEPYEYIVLQCLEPWRAYDRLCRQFKELFEGDDDER